MKNRYLLLAAAGLFAAALAPAPASALTYVVAGTSDPYLAGMPNGSLASFGDIAPDESPVQATGLDLSTISCLNFAATGQVTNGPGLPLEGPDGDPDNAFYNHFSGAENGLSDVRAHLNSLLGVFLDDSQPDLSPAPGTLDFEALGGFSSLSPLLKQVFFIGDGLTGTGSGSAQTFYVPTGATRLFLGTMDGFGWYNNVGSFTVDVTPCSATPEPGALMMLGSGLSLLGLMRRKGGRK